MENQETQNKCECGQQSECGCQQPINPRPRPNSRPPHSRPPIKQRADNEKTPAKFTGNSTFDFYFHELILTFTTEKSLFSSKKIERFLIFSAFMTITIIYVAFNIKEIESLELVELIGLWLAYGGYNTFQGYRDKKLTSEKPPIPDEIPYEEGPVEEGGVIINF